MCTDGIAVYALSAAALGAWNSVGNGGTRIFRELKSALGAIHSWWFQEYLASR